MTGFFIAPNAWPVVFVQRQLSGDLAAADRQAGTCKDRNSDTGGGPSAQQATTQRLERQRIVQRFRFCISVLRTYANPVRGSHGVYRASAVHFNTSEDSSVGRAADLESASRGFDSRSSSANNAGNGKGDSLWFESTPGVLTPRPGWRPGECSRRGCLAVSERADHSVHAA